MKECMLMFLFFALGYLIFNLIDELADRFIYKVKTVRLRIDAEDYKELKRELKTHGVKKSVEKCMQEHFTQGVKEYLENR